MAYDPTPARPVIKPPKSLTEPLVTDAAAPPPRDKTAPSTSLDDLVRLLGDVVSRQQMIERRLEAQPASPTRSERPQARKRVAVNAVGRNGERLSRRHDDSTNPFDLPPEFVEATRFEGYDLEWKAETVQGKDQPTYLSKLHANGWRPVPARRLPGMYAPENDEGPVRYDGMVLMERPLSLTEEARQDEERKAFEQVRMKHDSWGVDSKNTAVFDPNTPMAKSFTITPRSTVEPTDPKWLPTLEIAGEEV